MIESTEFVFVKEMRLYGEQLIFIDCSPLVL